MKLFILGLVLYFFLKLPSFSKGSKTKINRLEIITEEPEKSIQNLIELKKERNNLIFELVDEKRTLNEILSETLSETLGETLSAFPMGNENLVLKAFEEWLNSRDDLAASFAAYVRLYDPKLEPQYQGSNTDEFRNQCLMKAVDNSTWIHY